MAGYWPCFCFCMFLYGPSLSQGPLTRKNIERAQYPAILTDQPWPIRDLLYGKRTLFSRGIQRVSQSGQDSAILAARVANHRAGFGSSCPLT